MVKNLWAVFATFVLITQSFGQGTIVFHNRGLIDPVTGNVFNVPIEPFRDYYPGPESAALYLVNADGTYTPLPGVGGHSGVLTFRPAPNHMWLDGPISVEVPGMPAGTTGVQVVLRAWNGPSYDTTSARGQSDTITLGPLGGVPATGAPIIPPTLGGAGPGQGLESFQLVPEPATCVLFALGAGILLFRRRK